MTKRAISISTPLVEIPGSLIGDLSPAMIRKLAIAVAGIADRTDPDEVTVEDLLNYFPARYEDRSNFVQINALSGDVEAAVEIYVKTSGFLRVGKNRGPRQPPLFIFEITGADEQRMHKPLIVKWFVSGKQAERIVNYYQDLFTRGTRFVAYGKWEWDGRRNTFSLMVNKPEELEILQSAGTASSSVATDNDLIEDVGDPAFATVHTGKVPIYRKLGPFQTKRLREVIHSVLQNLERASVSENLPAELLERQDLINRAQALGEIHFPPEDSSLSDYELYRSPAHKRLNHHAYKYPFRRKW